MATFPLPPGVKIVNDDGTPTQYFLRYLFDGLFSGTIATAKLTPGGANGSMTFVNGRLTAQKAAT
jgi:hypothetical protein